MWTEHAQVQIYKLQEHKGLGVTQAVKQNLGTPSQTTSYGSALRLVQKCQKIQYVFIKTQPNRFISVESNINILSVHWNFSFLNVFSNSHIVFNKNIGPQWIGKL